MANNNNRDSRNNPQSEKEEAPKTAEALAIDAATVKGEDLLPNVPPVTKEEPLSKEDARMARMMTLMAKSMAQEMAAAMITAQKVPAQTAEAERLKALETKVRSRAKCPKCLQSLSGCNGRHKKIVVFMSKYRKFARNFQGVIINGVRYISNDPGHLITIPADAEGGILRAVMEYEENEAELRIGGREVMNDHSKHSGNPAAPMQHWR